MLKGLSSFWSRFVGISFTLLTLTFLVTLPLRQDYRLLRLCIPNPSERTLSEGKQMSVCSNKFISSVKRNQDFLLYIAEPTGGENISEVSAHHALNQAGGPILTFSVLFNVTCWLVCFLKDWVYF